MKNKFVAYDSYLTHNHRRLHLLMFIIIHLFMFMNIRVIIHTYTYIRIHAYTPYNHAYTYTHTYAYTRTYTRNRTRIHTFVPIRERNPRDSLTWATCLFERKHTHILYSCTHATLFSELMYTFIHTPLVQAMQIMRRSV